MDRRSELANSIRNGRPTMGTWMQIPSPIVAEVMAQTGFDFVLLDGEHAPVPPDILYTLLPAIERHGMSVIYRVRSNDADLIKAALDCGVTGLIVPMVNSPTEAREAVAAAKYPPRGRRGFSPWRASNYYREEAAYVASADDTPLIVQIETEQALKAVDEIAAVGGIDALYVGPADLAMSLGLPVGQLNDELRKACAKVSATAARNNIAAGIDVASLDYVPVYRELGYSLMTHGLDTGYILAGGQQHSAALREAYEGGSRQ
jgi:2-keto-3-deoxy-L-rhamnonate aldolase RhmA